MRRCTTHALSIQVMTTRPLPAPSKCKPGRFNAWGYSSMHPTTIWQWWHGRTPPGRPGQGVHRKGPGNHWWNSQQPFQQIARDLGVLHTTVNVCVKEDLKCKSYRRQTSQILTEKTKNLRLIKSARHPPPPSTWTRWTTSFGHMSTTSIWPPTTKLAWSLSICRAPAGACGKGMLPVPDRGSDWDWRQLHWRDVSSTT